LEFEVRSDNSVHAIAVGIAAAKAEPDRIMVENWEKRDGGSGWYLVAWASSRRDSSLTRLDVFVAAGRNSNEENAAYAWARSFYGFLMVFPFRYLVVVAAAAE
jgi:hypothetical protein